MRENVQTEKQIFAKPPAGHCRGEGRSSSARSSALRYAASPFRPGAQRRALAKREGACFAPWGKAPPPHPGRWCRCRQLEAPQLRSTAPVKAPRSWPKSSLSTSCGGRLAQSIFRKGASRRGPSSWIKTRKMILAGAAFAGDEERGGCGGDFLREFEETQRCGIFGDPRQPFRGHFETASPGEMRRRRRPHCSSGLLPDAGAAGSIGNFQFLRGTPQPFEIVVTAAPASLKTCTHKAAEIEQRPFRGADGLRDVRASASNACRAALRLPCRSLGPAAC